MPKMFYVKGFAAGRNATLSFGSVAIVIMVSSIAVIIAALKPAERSVELRTSATEELWKGDLINATGNALIVDVAPHFPLWIKVPRST